MDHIRFAVVGTNWITGALVTAGRTVDGFDVVAVHSRSADTGQRFADNHGIPRVHTSLASLATDDEVDAVYIASPNSLHAEQAIMMLRAGKHVLVEKPLGANAREVHDMAAAAVQADRILMEAYVSPWEPNMEGISAGVPELGQLRRVVLVKDQYSSRYDRLKSGELPNAFNPEFAAGSLMDLGFYPVALSVLLFGTPNSMHASGLMLPSGVDGQGTILLGYDGFEVACLHSKIAPTGLGSEIAGEDGVITFDDCSVPTTVRHTPRGGPTTDLSREQSQDHMRYEVEHFIACVRCEEPSPVWPVTRSLEVTRILDEARTQIGVHFPADTRKR